ncbi:hypothetical protein AQUCO_03900088v1, partial [Aquilegia coerulea]
MRHPSTRSPISETSCIEEKFLNIADSNHNQDSGIGIWVSDVREIAYDVDDVIDVFLRKVAYKEEGESSFMRYVHKPKKILNINKLRKKMETIFSKLEDISKRRKRYDVSIYGMGGLGKTTIAKEVYNHHIIKNHFDCYAWTSISQQMSTREVLKEIIREVNTQASTDIWDMNEVELVRNLFRFLGGKRYLVVLDDVWNTTDWDILKPAFPDSRGSKVMLSTRNEEIAIHADPMSFHLKPRFLTDNEGWELLCRKALIPLSSDLEECGRRMVKKCGGLPLAIIVLGGILQSKRSLGEWENVSKKIGISGHESRVLSILSLSYEELPYHLKPLFLYLGLFPEDSNIRVKKLVRMWMVERLIIEQKGETIEEVGRQCLDELIHRCMVQISEKRLGEERAKTCRLHDKIDFSSSSSSVFLKLRRCAIHVEEKGKQYVFPKHLTPCLQLPTAIFIPKDLSTKYCPNIMHKDFKSLKVLEFQCELKPEKEFCGVVRKLKNLHLSGKFKKGKLPSQFPSNLIKLTLDYTYFSEDPMPTLEKLQHLLFLKLYDSYLGKEMVCSAKGFPKLQNLQIGYSNQLEEWTVEEGAMPCLTKCLIEDCKELKMVPQGFRFLIMLQELKIFYMPKSFEQRVKEGGEDWQTVQHIPSIIIYSE